MLDSTKPWIGLRLNMHIVLRLNYTVAHKEMCSWTNSHHYTY